MVECCAIRLNCVFIDDFNEWEDRLCWYELS